MSTEGWWIVLEWSASCTSRTAAHGWISERPALSAAVLRTDVVEGTTLYRTGDLVFRDDRGNYVYVGVRTASSSDMV